MRDQSQQVSRQQSAGRQNMTAAIKLLRGLSIFVLLVRFSADCLLLTADSYAQELKDVKPPEGLPETPWILIIAVLLGVLFLMLGLWYWLRRSNRSSVNKAMKTPWETAYDQLNDLRRRDLFGQGKAKEHFIELSAIARTYIEDRFNIRAPEMTTEEFLDHVKTSPAIEAKHKNILKSFLQLCDMVKFAKYGPSAQEAVQSFELVKRFVDETKEISASAADADIK